MGDIGSSSTDDLTVWGHRVLLTHDVSTITKYAYERVGKGKYMPGVIEGTRKVPFGTAISESLYIAEVCDPGIEWADRLLGTEIVLCPLPSRVRQ